MTMIFYTSREQHKPTLASCAKLSTCDFSVLSCRSKTRSSECGPRYLKKTCVGHMVHGPASVGHSVSQCLGHHNAWATVWLPCMGHNALSPKHWLTLCHIASHCLGHAHAPDCGPHTCASVCHVLGHTLGPVWATAV